MKNTQTTIIVLERDKALHSLYIAYFNRLENYRLAGMYTSATEGLKDFRNTQPHIVLCELTLNGVTGLDAIKLFKEKKRDIKMVIFSKTNDFDIVKTAFKKGANGYLTKPLTFDKLKNALYSMEKEGAAMSSDIVKQVIHNFHRKKYAFFSARENEIVDYLCQGATYKVIADKLFVTTSAVNFHIQNIYLKLNVNCKSQALLKLERLEQGMGEC